MCVPCACTCVCGQVCLRDYIDSPGKMRGNITMAETINAKATGKIHTHSNNITPKQWTSAHIHTCIYKKHGGGHEKKLCS